MSKPKGSSAAGTGLCAVFAGTPLSTAAKGGMGAVKTVYKNWFTGGNNVRCSVDLDLALTQQNSSVKKWDYVFVFQKQDGVGVEPHAWGPDQVAAVVGKKDAAAQYLRNHCPKLSMAQWIWLVKEGSPNLPRNSAVLKTLAGAGLEYRVAPLTLP